MLEEVLGYRLAKEHSAADWSVRPLSAEMLRYAALDVEVLTDLRDALAEQLAEQGKTEWARQEFAADGGRAARRRPGPTRGGAPRASTGCGPGAALAVVRELWNVRDEIARDADLSPRRVLADQAIIEAARLPVTGQPPPHPAAARQDRRIPARGTRAGTRRAGSPRCSAPASSATTSCPRSPAPATIPGRRPRTAGPSATRTPPRGWPPRGRRSPRSPSAHRLPAENLLAPDAVRRITWEPPEPATPEAVAAALAGYGARPWQVELTAGPLAAAFRAAAPPRSSGLTGRLRPRASRARVSGGRCG